MLSHRTASASRFALCAWAFASIAPACANSYEATFTVAFPSTNVAVATETLDTSVFVVSRDDACEDIFERRRTNQTLPTPLVSTGPLRTCDVLGGRGEPLQVGLGNRAFLVVGKARGEEIVMGCEVAYVDDRSTAPMVRLTLFDRNTEIPATTCGSLADRCSGTCN